MLTQSPNNSVQYLKLDQSLIPNNWSNDPKYFDDSLPDLEDQPEFNFPPRPHILILAMPRNDVFLFQAGQKGEEEEEDEGAFYVWGSLAMILKKIEAQKTLKEILACLEGKGSMEMTVLGQ